MVNPFLFLWRQRKGEVTMRRKCISLVLMMSLLFQQTGFIYALGELDISSYLGKFSGAVIQDKFRPLHMRYFSYDTQSDDFKLLLDKGDEKELKEKELKEKTGKLLEYFKIGLSLPNDKFWVNLRPDAEDQIIDSDLEKTDIGKILLEADLQLKKDTAGATSPQTAEGKQYWDKLYKKAGELFGSENITIPTITRPWIVPGEVIINTSVNAAYIYKANLKVMLEEDYLRSQSHQVTESPANLGAPRRGGAEEVYRFSDPRLKELNQYSTQLIRELILPRLTQKVNSSKDYANLRQVYYSLILARWFKSRFQGKNSGYASLIDRHELAGLTSKSGWDKTTYLNQYKTSFSQGEYNIKEPVYGQAGQSIRSYFSGGFVFPEDVLPIRADKRASVDSSVKVIPISAGSAVVSEALTGNKNYQLFKGSAFEPDDTFASAASTLPPEQKIKEVSEIFDDEEGVSSAVTMNDYRDMFRDYDYRYNGTKPFDPYLGYLCGLSWAEMALQKAKEAGISDNYRVVVARDARKIEPDLFNNLVKGLMESGLDVINISAAGHNSVTSYSWAVQEFKPLMSIFITASHVSRPKEVMVRGFKVAMRDKSGRLSSLTTKEIKEVSRRKIVELAENPEKIKTLIKAERVNKFTPGYINENCVRMNTLIGRVAFQEGSLYDLARNMESAEAVSVLNEWENKFGASYPLKGMKVVIDAAHTPSGKLAAQTFQRLGAEAVLINEDIWEIEGEHKADPSKESNLVELDEAIKKENANFGMSFDLDGDRGVVRLKTENGRFMTLAPDNLIGVLFPFLIEKLGYDRKITNKKIGVIRDVLGTFGINDKAKTLEQKKGSKAEVFKTDAGYVLLKKQRQELLSRGYAIPIYGERSGHCWLDVTGEIENPLAIAVLFAVMVKKEKYKDNAALSLNPAIEAYTENAVPYKQSPRFMLPFHPSLLETLASEQRNDTNWKFNPSKPSENPPQALIALGRDRAIKALSREFITDKVYDTPFGKLKVKSFNAYQDSLDEGGLFRFADIMFEKPSGEFAGRFVFRASSNDPAFVCSYEAPIAPAESPDISENKVMSVAGVVLNWLVMNKYALVSEQSIRKELMLDESKAKKIAADFNLNPVESHLRNYKDIMLDLKIAGGVSPSLKLSAQELTSEIDYLTRMLGIKDYRRIIQIFRTSLNPEALVNILMKETGKTSAEILAVLRSSAFFRPIAANYRWKTSVLDESR